MSFNPVHSARGRLAFCLKFLILLLFATCHSAFAQLSKSVELRLSPSGGVTADDVVTYFQTRSIKTPPPLPALSVESPYVAYYLLPRRASGDFLTYLNNNPTLERAELERYVIVIYPANADVGLAVNALRAEAAVEWASVTPFVTLSSASLVNFDISNELSEELSPEAGVQYGRQSLNIDAAWQFSGGHALVGVIDNGLATNHALLKQFSSTGSYLGGNFVPASSLDLSLSGQGATDNDIAPIIQLDVDEMRPVPPPGPANWCRGPQGSLPPTFAPTLAGHGTHVAGLVAANGAAGQSKGTCKNCGIAMFKANYWFCGYPGAMIPGIDYAAVTASITYLSDTGAQVINLSLHYPEITDQNYCANNPGSSVCKALGHANTRGVTIVASSGNDRLPLDFPASDSRVISTGGLNSSLTIWDESPGSFTNCPTGYPTIGPQCGSNYTVTSGDKPQELMASAKDVVSLTYPNQNWNPGARCGDGFPGPMGSGEGLCTGTSMSAPQISGVAGILQSINPLVLPSKPIPNAGLGEKPGIRTVLVRNTHQTLASPSYWSSQYGYGLPDAAAAAKTMLGRVAGRQVVNRVTPLFRFYSTAANDYGDSTSPQMAMAYIISVSQQYAPSGSSISGYSSFPPPPPGTTALPAPKANVYVMTTANVPDPSYPPLRALYLMDRSRNFPVGCTPGAGGCNGDNRDLMLATTVSDIEQAHAQGYDLRTIQGYVYSPCTPETTCIPPGAQKFYRKCKTSVDDCATFLEFERTTFEGAGYTTAYPSGSSMLLGYAYPATDSDGDGLIDGMEYVIGSNPFSSPGAMDATYYPLAGVPTGDPCSGTAAAGCPADKIFKNGFQ